MKGGQTPIHIQRWAPADYHVDEHVRLLKARRDYLTLTFYRHFLDHAFTSGGDLPADPEALAAVVEMPKRDVEKALSFCVDRLIFRDGDRLYQRRVRRDVHEELEFRTAQAERGRLGGRRQKGSGGLASALNKESGGLPLAKPLSEKRSLSPPSPSPAPAPNNDPPTPLLTQGGNGSGPAPTRETPVEKRIRLWWIAIGGHPDRQDRRHVREALLAGHTEETVREQIAERVRDELIRKGSFDFDKPWPPPEVEVAS